MPGWDTSRPNWIYYRIREPTYDRYAQKQIQNGLWFVLGWRGSKSEVQSLRFDKRKGWTVERAKAWVKSHRKKLEQPEVLLQLENISEDLVKYAKQDVITKKMPGFSLAKPHGSMIFSFKKTLIVSPKPVPEQYINKNVFIVEDKQVLGVINIKSSKGPHDASTVRHRLRKRHKISDEEWNKWWPDAKQVYTYEFSVITTLDEPVPADISTSPHTWVKEVNIKFSEKKQLITPEKVKNILSNPSILKDKSNYPNKRLVDDHKICHMWRGADWKSKPLDLTKQDVRKLHGLIVSEMKRRGFEHKSILQESIELLLASPYAPIHRSGIDKGREVSVEEIKKYYDKPIMWKKGFVKLVGGIPNWGKSPGCIDLRIASDDLDEDHPVVFRLGRALPPEISHRADYHDRTYEVFTPFVDLYDLVLVPSSDRSIVHMQKGRIAIIRDATARKEASASIREDKIEPMRYMIPLKGHKGYYKFAELAAEVVAKWFLPDAWPIYREKKYDGARSVFMKKSDQWSIRSDDGALITSRFPNITKLGNGFLPHTITFDAEVELWKDGVHQSREVTSGHLRSTGAADDSELVVNVFDVMYIHGSSKEYGDVHKKPFEIRRKYLESIKWPQSTDGKPKTGTFNLTPSVPHKTPADLASGIKKIAGAIASEGAVLKSSKGLYELDGITRSWVKWKKMVDLSAVVVGSIETKTKGVFNLQLGLRIPSGWKVPKNKIMTVGNKQYMYIGKSFNVKGYKKPGTVVTISFHTLFHHIIKETEEQYVTTYEPQFVEVKPSRTPDTAKEAINVANKTEQVVRKFHSEADLEELFELERRIDVELKKKRKRRRDRCMMCSNKPTVEVRWADMRAHAWFCDACFEKWKKMPDSMSDTGTYEGDINRVRKLPAGIASEKWSEGPPRVVEMSLYNSLVSLAEIPMDDKPHKSVLQNHYRGKSVHMDFRIKVNNYAVGPTIAHQIPGTIKDPVDKLSEAKSIERSWPKYFKMTNEPQTYIKRPSRKLWISWKKPEPLPWLTKEGVVEEGPGRTKEHVGVFSIVESPLVYIGTQKPAFREYFLFGKRFNGRWVIRLLPNPWKAEMPRLEFVWLMWKPEDQTPYVITRRAVKKRWIPPYGISAMPPEWRNKIPKEYKFWTQKDTSKRIEMRDALVVAIRKRQVKLSGYTDVEMEEPPSISTPITVPGVLQHHWFQKETKPVRVGPTEEYWHLRIEWSKDKPLIDFVLNNNPIQAKAVSGIFRWTTDHSWMKRGTEVEHIPPGKPGNPTKATPAYIKTLEKLRITIFESSDTFMKMNIKNDAFKGHWIIVRSDPRANLYTLRREEAAPKAK